MNRKLKFKFTWSCFPFMVSRVLFYFVVCPSFRFPVSCCCSVNCKTPKVQAACDLQSNHGAGLSWSSSRQWCLLGHLTWIIQHFIISLNLLIEASLRSTFYLWIMQPGWAVSRYCQGFGRAVGIQQKGWFLSATTQVAQRTSLQRGSRPQWKTQRNQNYFKTYRCSNKVFNWKSLN